MLDTCYTRDDLTDYLRGQADDQLSGAIERHLDACPVCDETVSELETVDDSLIRSLRIRSEIPAVNSPAPAWVQSLAIAGGNNASSTSPPDQLLDQLPAVEPADQLGDYELLEVLGRGGMSIVFAARHKHLHRDVALKVLLPMNQQQSLSRERFALEMRAVGGLDHPAIVRATDAGECNDTLYLVMERVEGVDLNRVSRLEGPLRVADACAIGAATAGALAHAHQAGIVHRDIKPSNVMLDRDGKIKLLDFGLARMQSGVGEVSLQTTMGQLLGTLDYMAPEQAGGHEVDWRADMYALGAMLFKLLTGVPPHGRSAEVPIIEFLNRLANRDAPRMETYREALPDELVDLVACLLHRDVAQRDLTASEVAERLQGFAVDGDLPQLAADAMHKASQTKSPSPLSVKESLSEFLSSPPSMDSLDEPAAAVAFASPQPPRNTVGWIGVGTGLLSLLGLIVFGVVVSLKTPEGEIRIESELENVRVQVVDANEQVDVLTVDHGAAITTVRAGRYRVQLDSPSDRIEVTPKQLVVKQGQVVIAKVRQIPKPGAASGGNPQRDPAVVVEAQEQLAETMERLQSARRAPQQNAVAIKSLEAKLVRLRALTRPIPTEPVYQGRTLDDWVAQMRFEQEPKARKLATENVLRLATTRPDAEAIALLFEAGSIQHAALNATLAKRIMVSARFSESLDAVTKQLLQLKHSLVAATLASEMQSESLTRRDYAYWLCLDLRTQVRQGAWPQLLSALHSRIEEETGQRRLEVQLIYANCTADTGAAAKLLAEIDTQEASQAMFFALLAAVDERGLDVARDRQLLWAGEYLAQGDPSSIPEVCGSQAKVGPFRGVKWNDIDDALQADINTVVGPMLRVFEEKLAVSAERPTDWNAQQQTTAESNKLTDFVLERNLTGEACDRAVALLNQRLDQLLLFRANSSQDVVRAFDTPTRAAAAVQLLTGEVPAAIKQSVENEAGYLAEQFYEFQTWTRSDHPSGSTHRITEWYPFEVFKGLQADTRRNSGTNLKTFSPSATSCLLFNFAQSSPEAAEFANRFANINDIVSVRDSHPLFATRVADLMNTADNLAACELAYRIWAPGRREQELNEKLANWMKSGDATQARFAISEVLAGGHQVVNLQIPPAWTSSMVTTLQRLGEQGELRATEMRCVHLLKEQIPEAPQYAVDYIRYWLSHPQEQSESKDLGLVPCLSLLKADPERVAEVHEPIQRFLETNSDLPRNRSHMILTLIVRIQANEKQTE